jgi:hypothetical protein
LTLPCPPPSANTCGQRRAPKWPISAAASTIAGNGVSKAKIATKDAAAMPHIQRFFSARVPMRWAACSTRAVTAGFSPKKMPATSGMSPKRR